MELSILAKNIQFKNQVFTRFSSKKDTLLHCECSFEFSSFCYCSREKFQGCCFVNGEENYCYICQFEVKYDLT